MQIVMQFLTTKISVNYLKFKHYESLCFSVGKNYKIQVEKRPEELK